MSMDFFRKYHAVPANDDGPQFGRATAEALRGWAQGDSQYAAEAHAELAKRGESAEVVAPADPVPAWLKEFPTEKLVAVGVANGRAGYELGLGSLRMFFAEHVEEWTEPELKRFREEAIKRAMREACNAGAPVYFHATVR